MIIDPYRFVDAGPSDPYFSNVELLLHFEGTNGSTAVIDNSQRNRAMLVNGLAAISTAEFRDGASSLLPNAGYAATTSTDSDLQLGNKLFCIEVSGRKVANFTGAEKTLVGQWGPTNYSWVLGVTASQNLFFYVSNTGTGGTAFLTFGTVPNTGWHDFCVQRVASGNLEIYMDGIRTDIVPGYGSFVFHPTGYPTGVGADSGGFTDVYPDHVDKVRITVGASRYTGDYTPDIFPNH